MNPASTTPLWKAQNGKIAVRRHGHVGISAERGQLSLHKDLTLRHEVNLMKITSKLFPRDGHSVLQ